jgi:acyl-CoA synthetase (NDP forming)
MNKAREIESSLQEKGLSEQIRGFMICEMVPFSTELGNELLISAKSDDAFGEVLSIGFGGVNTEFYAKWMKSSHSVRFFSADSNAEELKSALDGFPPLSILCGKTRASGSMPEESFVNFLLSLAGLMRSFSQEDKEQLYTIEEIELNPAVASAGKLYALDGVLRFSRRKLIRRSRPVRKIKNLLYPESVVVIGVSSTRQNQGRIILNNLIEGGGLAKENLFVIHKKEKVIEGCPCVPSFRDLPKKVDLAVISVPASSGDTFPAGDALKEIIEADKTESVILIPGGFGETKEGQKLQEAVEKMIENSRSLPGEGPVIDGGNCLGIISAPGNYNTFFIPRYKLPFDPAPLKNVAFISQSGAFLVSAASKLNRVFEPRFAISYGNQMDLTVCDYLEFLQNDEKIDVFSVYVEGFRELDGRRMISLAREIRAKGKRILLFKGGRSALGAQAAASHTAAIAGEFGVFRDLISQAGVIISENMDEFDDMLHVFAALYQKKKNINTVGVISNAGFESTLASDSMGSMKPAVLSPETSEKIESMMAKGIVDLHNPLDLTPMVDWPDAIRIGKVMLNAPETDAMVFSDVPMVTSVETLPPGRDHDENIYRENSYARLLIEWFHESEKPLLFCFDGGALYDPLVAMLKEAGLPVFRRMDAAMNALDIFATDFRQS